MVTKEKFSGEALIFDAFRTPRGRGKSSGSLGGVKPITLASGLLRSLQDRNPSLDVSAIDDLVMGIATPVGEQGAVLPRFASLAAGLPETIAGLQVNRFCGSGLEAVNIAAQKVRSGWDDLVVAGGVESMSHAAIGADGGPWMNDPETNVSTGYISQGVSADLIATVEGFSRTDVDELAVRSQELAASAWQHGYFDRSIVPVCDRNGIELLARDEFLRPETSVQSLAQLAPAFAGIGREGGFDAVALRKYHWLEEINHVHHAGNSSGIVDGSALVLVGSEAAGARQGMVPRGRIAATATAATEPTIMLTGPTPATLKLLHRTGLTVDDIDLFEINEAFASVVLKFVKDLEIPMEKVNVNGGAIALGHPLGATGAMLIGVVLDELERRDARRAVVTLCIGGGMGLATLVERIPA